MSTNPKIARSGAWSSVMARSEEPDFSETVRLAELGVNGAPEYLKANHLNTLGAALYRAGRFAEAARRLEEAIQKRRGVGMAEEWVFLAMAQQRLGHHDEARRWLDQLRDDSPSVDGPGFWSELQVRLLRAEAEAVVLYDPIFPAEPFSR
jgi:tetratricopeptide (TPR) repeat protein